MSSTRSTQNGSFNESTSFREWYNALYHDEVDPKEAREFLQRMNISVENKETVVSNKSIDKGLAHLEITHKSVLANWLKYANNRQDGAPRLFFPHLDACKWFLLHVCPTKMVDGCWLKGVDTCTSIETQLKRVCLSIYDDEIGRSSGIVKTHRNHAEIFRRLFESAFSDFHLNVPQDWIEEKLIPDEAFAAGAIQMALALCTNDLLPEVLGYNLGYEQLAFHLLVTSRELEEVGLDPYYFTLHVTTDNFHTGHAAVAVKACRMYLESIVDKELRQGAWRRIQNGFALSEVGVNVEDLMQKYTTKAHLEAIFKSKCKDSAEIHSDVILSHVKGQEEVNLYDAMRQCETISLVELLQANDYFTCEDGDVAPFWKILQEGACMHKVFDKDELGVIKRYINERREEEFSASQNIDDTYIHNVLKRYAHKHRKVMLTHPVTGEVQSLTDWNESSWKDTKECLLDPSVLNKTLKSFEFGKMKGVSPIVKSPCVHWLKNDRL